VDNLGASRVYWCAWSQYRAGTSLTLESITKPCVTQKPREGACLPNTLSEKEFLKVGVFLEAFSESLCAGLRGRGELSAFLTLNSSSVMVARSAAQEG
jgi:hypothetical protein